MTEEQKKQAEEAQKKIDVRLLCLSILRYDNWYGVLIIFFKFIIIGNEKRDK